MARHLATWSLVHAVQQPTWPGGWASAQFQLWRSTHTSSRCWCCWANLGSLLLHRSLVPWQKVAAAIGLSALLVLPLAVTLLSTNRGRPAEVAADIDNGAAGELAGISSTRSGVLQGAVFVLAVSAWWRHMSGNANRTTIPFSVALHVAHLLVGNSDRPRRAHLTDVAGLRDPVLHRCLPALLLLVAVGLSVVRPALQAVALLVLLVAGTQSLGIYAQDHKEGENWRALVQHVALEAQGGDRVVFLSHFGRRPFEYYLDRHPGLGSSLTPAYPSMPWATTHP